MDKKRKSEDKKLRKYREKIRKIEKRRQEKSRATTPTSAIFSIQGENCSDNEIYSEGENQYVSQMPMCTDDGENIPPPEPVLTELQVDNTQDKSVPLSADNGENLAPPEPVLTEVQVNNTQDKSVPLSTEVLNALGDVLPEQPKFGPKICEDVARILNTILKCGLKKEAKASLLEDLIPENCSLLIAPKMNMDIINTVGDKIHNRDKKIESEQNQLGLGLSMLSKILATLTLTENVDRLEIISSLCNAVRILADLHAIQTKARKNLTLPNLDKTFLSLVKDVPRDEFLFGNDLHQKISALTTSQRNAKAICKKPPQNPKQGNYNGPSRYHQTGSRAVMRNGPKKPPVARGYQFQNQHNQRFSKPQPNYPKAGQSNPHAPSHK